jgi:hypothetical protein
VQISRYLRHPSGVIALRNGARATAWRLQKRHLAKWRLKLAAIEIWQAVGKV